MNVESIQNWIAINVTGNKSSAKKSETSKGSYYQGPNNQFYYIEVLMYNQLKDSKPLNVPFFLVESLTIHESIFTWARKAEIVFNNDFEVFLRGDPAKNNPPYIDRTDGRNKVYINIHPIDVTLDNGDINLDDSSDEKFPRKYWEMDYDFIVSEIVDLPVANNQAKKRMYVLIDERYQILKERNLEWSSEMFSLKLQNLPDDVSLTDKESSLNPNIALKEFLKFATTNGDMLDEPIYVGFDGDASIEEPNIRLDQIDDKRWDAGDDSNLCLFYSTANRNALDDLYYILSHCMSSDGFPVLLDYGRSSEDKGWNLISISKIYEDSNLEQVERLIIEDNLLQNQQGDIPPYVARANESKPTQINNFTSIAASRILSYKYSPMVSMDDNRILNSPVALYDEHTGVFSIKKQDNSVFNVFKKLNEMATKGLYSFQQKKGAQILLNLNKTKLTGQMTRNHFPYNGPYGNQKSPLLQMILDSIFLNQSISFQTLGLTLRTPGKFIFIDRIGAGEKNVFDDRVLGQWLITNVSHRFTQESYKTEVTANKIDSFSTVFKGAEDKL
jgi:hypothetical protein